MHKSFSVMAEAVHLGEVIMIIEMASKKFARSPDYN